jgi:predicted lipoprotein with Yx(FWY)xxD motif
MGIKAKTVVAVTSVAAIALLVTAVTLAATGATKSSKATVTVSTRTVAGLGTILVNSAGKTLYMFVPDKRRKVTCFKTCAKIWPPLKLPVGAKIVAKGAAKKALLGSDKDTQVSGGRVVTYNHWPLYTYLGDPKAGVAAGQALNLNGGLWYVLSPSGAVIKTKPGGGGGGGGGGGTTTGTSTGGGGGGSNCSDDDGDGDGTAGGPDDGDGCI